MTSFLDDLMHSIYSCNILLSMYPEGKLQCKPVIMLQAPLHWERKSVISMIDKLEALRLADLSGLSQEEASRTMNISKATFGRIASRARRKVADALVHGKGICIEGGIVRFHPPYGRTFRRGPHGRGKGPLW